MAEVKAECQSGVSWRSVMAECDGTCRCVCHGGVSWLMTFVADFEKRRSKNNKKKQMNSKKKSCANRKDAGRATC
jgi:hypothetical protein